MLPNARNTGETPRMKRRRARDSTQRWRKYPSTCIREKCWAWWRWKGQGQDELFECLAGFLPPILGRQSRLNGKPVRLSPPRRCHRRRAEIRSGRPGGSPARPKVGCAKTSPCPFPPGIGNWGNLKLRRERDRVAHAIERLQIDTRAQGEVQRLSGRKPAKGDHRAMARHGRRDAVCCSTRRAASTYAQSGRSIPWSGNLPAQGAVGPFLHFRA